MSGLVVHHLDCCTMCPRIGRVNEHNRLVGHVLAIETPDSGVVLVDTGIGTAAREQPTKQMGRFFPTMFRPDLSADGTAVAQLRRLNLAHDVRHIIVTHLDTDHAGGLADFPNATVHLHADELAAARSPRSLNERSRYRDNLWQHVSSWSTFDGDGEPWFGFASARPLPGLPDDIVAIPLAGHTRGHTAIGVRSAGGWLLHCGDGYFHRGQVHAAQGAPAPTRAVRRFERMVAVDRRKVAANHDRLAELARASDVRVFSAHDPDEFATFHTG